MIPVPGDFNPMSAGRQDNNKVSDQAIIEMEKRITERQNEIMAILQQSAMSGRPVDVPPPEDLNEEAAMCTEMDLIEKRFMQYRTAEDGENLVPLMGCTDVGQ